MVAIATQLPKQASKKKVPDYLVKDEIDGIRFYYRDYKLVINKRKTINEIVGCSGIQSLVIQYLMKVLFKNDVDEKYYIFTNEGGNNLSLGNNYSFDIALYDRKMLSPEAITKKYVQGIAPHTVIEVDTDISLDDTGFDTLEGYYFTKTKKLIAYGTQKVIWVFTASQKILVAEGKDWHIYDFDKTIQLIDNVEFNIADFLQKEQIVL